VVLEYAATKERRSKNMSEPSVSVCLTAYKREQTIAQNIESLLGQDFGDFELVISDDASPDNTEDVCRAYQQLDSRVSYFRSERNLGMPGNLNAGLRRCRSPLLANLHDGDIYRKDLLSKWKLALDRNTDAAFHSASPPTSRRVLDRSETQTCQSGSTRTHCFDSCCLTRVALEVRYGKR
jgi:glycosyltransferase involved in cell wall biosynthesis